ncbi:alpha-2-macroglobulin family protein [Roseibacillus ishigakijimensis]|uniref:Alpha-2-macroglobulin domain-containing protein n=1 Tax=Roseibacillus ishigakijimensis TaxID=454146 RepID=A0A934RMQ0_9BACT|nr:alpha-2-macroglobulin family protein [Roseibacillus ishigakijimensis]MBK1832482.1 hypothetical protein [Roseibacillus ishigakijimensis]
MSANRDAQWKAVAEAQEKDQPQTVVALLKPLEEAARAEQAWGEAGKALVMRLMAEGEVHRELPQLLVALEDEIAEAPAELEPVLELLSASLLHRHYQQNRWRYAQRTRAGVDEGEDIAEWSLPRMLDEIDERLQAALDASELLQTLSASALDGLLEKKSALGEQLRPTLYDFIAHEAAGFYALEETAAAKPGDLWEMVPDSPALGEVEDFLAWQPETDGSPQGRALVIYQNLLRFHENDEDPTAFLHGQLERLLWAEEAIAGESGERFRAALRKFIAENEDHFASARARYLLAEELKEEGELVAAHEMATAGRAAFPEHPYGLLCGNVVKELEERELQLATETQWTPAGEAIQVTHKNVGRVWFRLYAMTFGEGEEALASEATLDEEELRRLLQKEPARSWVEELPDEGDYARRTSQVTAPQDVDPGYYFLVASAKEDFSIEDNVVASQGIHVTRLALVTRRAPQGGVDGFVVDAVTGAPQSGVEVKAWWQPVHGEVFANSKKHTDESGYFAFPKMERRYVVIAQREQDRAVARSWANQGSRPEKEGFQRSVFFTDRAIYRPGQTIHFKAILAQGNQAEGDYATLPDRAVTVRLLDVNREEVAQLSLTSNARGSVAGAFPAPQGRALGRYQIVCEEISGSTSVRVEEYKRPKFFSEIEAASNEAALGEEVKVTARAEAYTGAAVDGAKVAWRVTRQTRWPDWIGWWRSDLPHSSAEEIAQGEGETDAQGQFELSFTAKPDAEVPVEQEPVFDYLVTVDITDGAGETRSASRTISVAYTTLQASLETDAWLTTEEPVAVRVRTLSHDGEPRAAEGVVKIHRLQEPETCPRAQSGSNIDPFAGIGEGVYGARDIERPEDWELGEMVREFAFSTSAEGEEAGLAELAATLDAGAYRLVLTSKDANGREVKAFRMIQVLDPAGEDFPTMVPFYTVAPEHMVEPGEEFSLLWGSGHEEARAVVEIYQDQQLLQRTWTQGGRTQEMIRFPVTEKQRGGFTVTIFQVSQNRFHQATRQVSVPWTNQELTVRWEHMVNKLEPGAKESWTAVVEGAGGEAAVAEMVATMYDASLDAFASHRFRDLASFYRRESGVWLSPDFSSDFEYFEAQSHFASGRWHSLGDIYRGFFFGETGFGSDPGLPVRRSRAMAMPSAPMMLGGRVAEAEVDSFAAEPVAEEGIMKSVAVRSDADGSGEDGEAGAPVSVRTNLNETAFFFPDLVSDEEGRVRISFTIPEALTTWRFLALAHDDRLRSGLLESEVVTAKDLMVQPNPPRFLREGDELEFTVKVTNQSEETQSGVAKLDLADAATDESRNAALGVEELEKSFEIPAKESRTVSWRLSVPDGAGFLRYRATATTGSLTDGEEGWLPVLPRRVLVTESMALPIRDAGEKEFAFDKLLASGDSETLQNQFVHLQVVSQPAWYAVMALPYLMEFPHECAEQTFNRYYANALAAHIANSDAKIRRIFDLWKNTEALDSPLLKNEDLKGLLLEETPWLAEAKNESEARRRVGLLFEENKLTFELEQALQKVSEMQGEDGLWPWFPGGRGNAYISRYLVTGFARLRHLGVESDLSPALQALAALDADLSESYERIRRNGDLDENNLSQGVAHHLYMRSFFLRDKKLTARDQVAFDYFVAQAKEHWTSLSDRMSRAHTALALHRLGETETAQLITRSLKEHALVDEEQGMRWNDERGWWWWQAPIESQALMIEAFAEVDQDEQAVEDCQVWLIKQKQVGDWETTKATADAVYALLMGGRNLLSSKELLEVTLGGEKVVPEQVEPGTGMYEERLMGAEVKPALGQITLHKKDKGVAWASLHWQYLEDLGKVTSEAGEELQLEKRLFVKRHTDQGEVLEPVTGPVAVGDELVTRLILRNDRAMEFVHLKDQRGSGTEPVNVLSGYRWQDGFGYYEMTRDTASHFFIDHLPAGTHVFETSVRVQHRGVYQTGLAEIRCMYAPEFAAHSASVAVEVR